MSFIRNNIFSLFVGSLCILSFFTEWYMQLSVILFIFLLLVILDKLGRGLVLRELIAFYSVFVCLIMPIFGYKIYNKEYLLANLFSRYMRVPENVYFEFAFPATAIFILVLCWPIKEKGFIMDEGPFLQNKINRFKKDQFNGIRPGLILIGVGIVFSFILESIPVAFRFFATIFYFSSFAGILYLYFSPNFKLKNLFLTLFALFIILGAIRTGIFTVVAYMGITIFSFFFLGRKVHLFKKVFFLIGAAFIFIVLQNTKISYRQMVWLKTYSGDKTTLFTSLFIENLQKGENLFDKKTFYPVYVRTNQGFNLSLVMNRIPAQKPFDNGKALMTSVFSSLVPRFLWPDKPEAGGKFNMAYYAGWRIVGWATNVGPLGEAYGSFGVKGGILFMFILGLFMRWTYKKVFIISKSLPVVIFWIPVLFYQSTYSAENDTLQILNSIIKTAFFIYILYKLFPSLFLVKKQEYVRRPVLIAP